MSNFWSGLSGIKSKAADALNKAKEQIKDFTEEPIQDPQSEILLQAQKAIERQKSEKIETEQKYSELAQRLKEKEDSLINFQIIVGSPDSPLLMKELEFTQKKLSEAESVNSLLQVEKNKAIEELSSVSAQLTKAQESIQNMKRSSQTLINSCYESLKESTRVIGLSIPNIRPEDIGLEDVQEFISTQTEYLKDANTRTLASLTKHSPAILGKKLKVESSVESVRQATSKILEEAASKLKQAHEIRVTSEDLYQKTLKHTTELTARMTEEQQKSIVKDAEIKKLSQQVQELSSNVEDVQTIKDDHQRLLDDYNKHIVKYESLVTSTEAFDGLKQEHAFLKQSVEQHSSSSSKLSQENSELVQENKDLKNQVQALSNKVRTTEVELISYKNNFLKLQEVLNGLETELEGKTRNIDSLTEEIEELTERAQLFKEKEDQLKGDIEALRQQVKDEQSAKGAFEANARDELVKAQKIKEEAESLLSKVDDSVNSSQNIIDKRVVSTFIVNLLSASSSEKVKMQMLSTLANMLDFDEAQRRKVGLIEEATFFSQLANFIHQG